MNQSGQLLRDGIVGDVQKQKRDRFVRISMSLSYGIFMFFFVNGCEFISQHRRLTDTRERVWLPISLLLWVGWSYAWGEWRYRRLKRQDEEDR